MKSSTSTLAINELSFKRSKQFELNIQSLSIVRGEVVCVVGANGSGKTTLMELAVGLLSPSVGNISIAGRQLKLDQLAAKRDLGYIPDDDQWVIAELTAREYFYLLNTVYRQAGCRADIDKNIPELANQLLFSQFDLQLGSLSHGNKRKVQIIAALMHQPKLLVVDELRNGLDPISIKRAEELLKKEAERGVAVLASTHDLWWAERFARRVVMIKDGQVMLSEKTNRIIKTSGSLENRFMELYGATA